MKNKKLFIFDLDGTLVDTAPDFKNSLNYMLSELDYPLVSLEEIRNLVGYGARELIRRTAVTKNIEHDLAGNAQYWYAETFRIRQLYTDAASAYLEGYQKYPKGNKAPINLLKLGVSMVQIGEKDQGCKMINGVQLQYPKANQSVIQKAKYESKKFECTKQDS